VAAAITKQISPINDPDQALVELVTVTNYPFSLVLNGVTTLSGGAPSSFSEDVANRACPSGTGGTQCRQRFELYFPYSTCQWNNAQYTLSFSFTSPGVSGVNETITLNSEDWCAEFGATGPAAPAITSISPTVTPRGVPVTITVNGSNLNATGGIPVVVTFDHYSISPVTVTANQITFQVNGDLTSTMAGPVAITVQTAGGVSNQLLLNLQ
jgi:hypothetical protein